MVVCLQKCFKIGISFLCVGFVQFHAIVLHLLNRLTLLPRQNIVCNTICVIINKIYHLSSSEIKCFTRYTKIPNASTPSYPPLFCRKHPRPFPRDELFACTQVNTAAKLFI